MRNLWITFRGQEQCVSWDFYDEDPETNSFECDWWFKPADNPLNSAELTDEEEDFILKRISDYIWNDDYYVD